MLFKSRGLAILLMVLLAASVFAGGGRQSQSQNWDDQIVRVLNYNNLTLPNVAGDLQWIYETFNEKHPEISVYREDLYLEPFHAKVEAYAASGNLPDVIMVWPSGRSTTLHKNKLLKDLTPLLRRDNLLNSFIPMVTDPKQSDSGYVSFIPLDITSSHAFYINMEVLNACGLQPAKTYSELKAQVPVLRARGYETVIIPCKADWVMQSCLFSTVAGRFGGADWHERILAGTAKFTDPDFVNALDFIRQMYADGVILQSSLGMDYDDGPGAFATNKSAYYIDGDWRASAFITDADTGQALFDPNTRQKNVLVTVFPDIEGAKINKSASIILGTGWAMNAAIPAGSKREAAAWELLKWLTGREVLELGLLHGNYATSTRTDIDIAGLDLEPLLRAVGNLNKEYTTGTAVIDGVFNPEVYMVVNDGLTEIGLGSKTPQQVAQDVQRAFDSSR